MGVLDFRFLGHGRGQPTRQTTGHAAVLHQKQFFPGLQAGEELGDAGRKVIEIEAFHNGENLPRLRA